MSTVGLAWPLSGGVGILSPLPGDTDTLPQAANNNGLTIVGSSGTAGFPPSSGQPVRWDSLIATALASVSGPTTGLWLARDASIIVGSAGDETSYSRWTSGGSAGALLPPATGYTGTRAPSIGGEVSSSRGRMTSDDGTVAIGDSTGGSGSDPAVIATVWTNGVPATLPAFFGGTNNTFAKGCSTNGLFVFGLEGDGPTQNATYWTGGTSHPLAGAPVASNLQEVFHCDAAGSIIYGHCITALLPSVVRSGCYWSNLGSVSGGLYGTVHILDPLPGGPPPDAPAACSETGNISVGGATDSGGTTFATKWNGTTATNLGTAPGFLDSFATGCSADGSIVVGWARDMAVAFWPCYWDASNVIHLLPTIANAGDSFQGVALGISRDGTVAWGTGDAPTITPLQDAAVADLFFTQTNGFADPASEANRRKFYAVNGGAQNLGLAGENPFGGSPQIFLTSNGTPATFALNNGRGGPFSLFSGALTASATDPPGSSETVVTPGSATPRPGVLGDYRNGNLYAFNPATYTDNGTPRKWIRRWRALPQSTTAANKYSYLAIDMETGAGVPAGTNPQLMLRWSDDGGHTWSSGRILPAGKPGQTAFTVKFNRLGATSRFGSSDRIFELSSTDPFRVALLDADMDVA